MNSKNIVALEDKTLCMVCLKEKATHKYKISCRGYGSLFDEDNTYWQCCDKCHRDEYDIWANEQPKIEDEEYYYEEYKYEDKILDFIHNLPLQSQELFFNSFSSDGYNIDAQDWIDYKLDELPHEKCKEYYLIYNKRN
jgi:hypothetical protein